MLATSDDVAIIGMAGRFPGARNVAELWQNLLAGRETIDRFGPDELEHAHAEDMESRSDPQYVRARGVLADVDKFDDQFFGFSPDDAVSGAPRLSTALEPQPAAAANPADPAPAAN